MLGHTTIGVTGRYLNATEQGLKEGFKKLEAARRRRALRVVNGNGPVKGPWVSR